VSTCKRARRRRRGKRRAVWKSRVLTALAGEQYRITDVYLHNFDIKQTFGEAFDPDKIAKEMVDYMKSWATRHYVL
jgi:hypothetical protein